MANYNTLKTSIEAVIKQNGNNEITGALLQQALLSMITSLGAGYQYMGIATPSTNPGTPDQNVFYFALEAGTYSNFSGIVVADNEVAILKWNGSWVKETTGVATAAQVNQLDTIVKELQPAVFGVTFVQWLLNKAINGSTGTISDVNGWIATDPFYLAGDITLSGSQYNIHQYVVYDENKTRIGASSYPLNTNKIDYDSVIALFPTAKYIALNIYSGSSTPVTESTVNGWELTQSNSITDIEKVIDEINNSISEINNEIDEIKSSRVLVDWLLNKAINGSTGTISDVNGWIATDPFYLAGDITLSGSQYNIYQYVVYDENKTRIGASSYPLNTNKIDYNTVLTEYPLAKYVALNIYSGSTTPVTQSDIQNWYVEEEHVSLEKLSEQVANLDQRVTELETSGSGAITVTFDKENKTVKILSDLSKNYFVENSGFWHGDNELSANPCFNFGNTRVIDKNTQNSITVNATELDAIGSTNLQFGWIGGNHGVYSLYHLNVPSHGKTFADIGSEWTDGTHKWYIVAIPNANTINVISEYYLDSKSFPLFYALTASSLTHVSGATHTGTIEISSSSVDHWYPSEYIVSKRYFIDGVEITESGVYTGKEFDAIDVYDVASPTSMLDIIKQRVGTFTANPVPKDYIGIVDVLFRQSSDFRFMSGGCNVLFVDWTPRQNLEFYKFICLNVKLMNGSAFNGGLEYYLPKGTLIDSQNNIHDFRIPKAYVSAEYANSLYCPSSQWENPDYAPDRGIELITDGTKPIVGLHHGYAFNQGIGGGMNRKNYVNDAWWIHTSGAIQNGSLDQKVCVNGILTMGKSYRFVAFRKYEDYSDNVAGLVSNSQFWIGDKYYIYADFEAPGTYDVKVSPVVRGKKTTVLEKSDNVTLYNETANDIIQVGVTTATPMYGFIVIEIE